MLSALERSLKPIWLRAIDKYDIWNIHAITIQAALIRNVYIKLLIFDSILPLYSFTSSFNYLWIRFYINYKRTRAYGEIHILQSFLSFDISLSIWRISRKVKKIIQKSINSFWRWRDETAFLLNSTGFTSFSLEKILSFFAFFPLQLGCIHYRFPSAPKLLSQKNLRRVSSFTVWKTHSTLVCNLNHLSLISLLLMKLSIQNMLDV